MKRNSIIPTALLLMTVLVASCRSATPVAPVLASTPVLTAIPSFKNTQPVPAESLFMSPTSPVPSDLSPFAVGGPEKDVSSYRLRSWSEADYDYVVDKIDHSYEMDELNSQVWKRPDYHTVFQSERLLKYPGSPNTDPVLWDILLHKPGTAVLPGLRPGDDLMALLISRLLTKERSLVELKREIENHGPYVPDVFIAKNLIGNGQDGLVILMQLSDDIGSTGAYAIFPVENGYYIEQISSWEMSQYPAMGRYFSLEDIGDPNQNGLPEIVLQVESGYSGIPGGSDEIIQHIEWSPSDGKFIKDEFPVYSQTCEDPCKGDWEFINNNSQSMLVTRSYWDTRGDCPDLVIQSSSSWDGVHYVLGKSEILSPEENLSPACRLAWAEAAVSVDKKLWDGELNQPGWENDLAISIFEDGLKNWPASGDELWGPAGRDYLKLRLGLIYELRGEGDRAKSLLKQLANRPSVPEYDFVSRLAKIYLQTRADEGKTKACLKIGNTYSDELQTILPEETFNFDESILKAWGMVSWQNNFLCSPDDMLPADVESASLKDSEALLKWLKKSGISITQQEMIDLNGDGREDALILLDAYESDDPDAWAFFASPKGYQARYVYDFWPNTENPEMEIVPLQTGSTLQTYLIKVDDGLAVIGVSQNLDVTTLVEETGVQSYEISEVNDRPSVSVDIDDYDAKSVNTYLWDPETQSFVPQADLFEQIQTHFEDALFNNQDYAGVASGIEQFLATAPPEPQFTSYCGADVPGGCAKYPPWYVPYFRYLRGLAYEQLGQEKSARRVYYDLWKDFPNHLFGIAAGLKLEPINP